MIQLNSTNVKLSMDKFQAASPMNSPEEKKCDACEQVIFEKELYMLCRVKEFKGEIKLKNYCCDCFKKKAEEDMERIEKWSKKTIWEIAAMLNPIMNYMGSETKKKIDANRKLLKRIEGEGVGEL